MNDPLKLRSKCHHKAESVAEDYMITRSGSITRSQKRIYIRPYNSTHLDPLAPKEKRSQVSSGSNAWQNDGLGVVSISVIRISRHNSSIAHIIWEEISDGH